MTAVQGVDQDIVELVRRFAAKEVAPEAARLERPLAGTTTQQRVARAERVRDATKRTSSMTPTLSGIETVRAFMERINVGDVAGSLGYVHPEIDVQEPWSMPYGGRYAGHEEFQVLMGKIHDTWTSWRETPNRFAEGDGVVFRECTVRGRLRSTGAVVEMPFVEMFEFRDGLIVTMRPHYWNAGLLRGPGAPDGIDGRHPGTTVGPA